VTPSTLLQLVDGPGIWLAAIHAKYILFYIAGQ
jgi:hypothetical protein